MIVMKDKLKNRIAVAIFISLAMCMFNSCNKDDSDYDITGDPVNRVYLNTETSYVNNYKFAIIHTPILSDGNIIARFPVRCTKEAGTEIKVTLAIDNSIVDLYNSTKATMYSKVPDGKVTLSNTTVTIPKGGIISVDSITVAIPAEVLTELRDAEYLIPVKITALNQSAGAEICTNLNICYLLVSTGWTNCYSYQTDTDMVGDLITDRSLWEAAIDVSLYSGSLSQLFDGSTNSYWQVRPPEDFNLVVDLAGEFINITGIRTNCRQTSYGMVQVNVYTSPDSLEWTFQGSPILSTSSTNQYIRFYAPVTAMYIRLELVSSRSSSRIYMGEFDIYRQE